MSNVIDRRAVIDALDEIRHVLDKKEKELTILPSAQPEPLVKESRTLVKDLVNDAISRQVAIVQLSHNKTGDDDCDVVIQNDIETIKALPSAEPERKKGKWIYYDPNGFKCSECGGYLEIEVGDVKMKFCPNCGSYNGGKQE